jgi:hypothetical protein
MTQKIRIGLFLAILAAAVYAAQIFYSRWQQAETYKRSVEQANDQRATSDMRRIGGDQLKIGHFYGPPMVAPGQPFELCYSTLFAKKLTLQPPLTPVNAAFSKCTDSIRLDKTTKFTLTATDAENHSVTAEFTVQVRP